MQVDRVIYFCGDDGCFVQVTASSRGEGGDRVKAFQGQPIAVRTKTVVRLTGTESEVTLYTMPASHQKTPSVNPKTDEPSRPIPAHLYFTVTIEILVSLSQQNTTLQGEETQELDEKCGVPCRRATSARTGGLYLKNT